LVHGSFAIAPWTVAYHDVDMLFLPVGNNHLVTLETDELELDLRSLLSCACCRKKASILMYTHLNPHSARLADNLPPT
jgi:hypothetical protein